MVMPDRRQYARVPLQRPVKLRLDETGKYASAESVNVSAGGAKLQMRTPCRLQIGQRVSVGIAAGERQPVILAGQMLDAVVVRSLGMSGVQHVAVRCDTPCQLAAAI